MRALKVPALQPAGCLGQEFVIRHFRRAFVGRLRLWNCYAARLNGCRFQDSVTCWVSHGFIGGSIGGTGIVMRLIGWRFLSGAICGLSDATETALGSNGLVCGCNGLAWPRHCAGRKRSRVEFSGFSQVENFREVGVPSQANNGTGNEDRRQIEPSVARRRVFGRESNAQLGTL